MHTRVEGEIALHLNVLPYFLQQQGLEMEDVDIDRGNLVFASSSPIYKSDTSAKVAQNRSAAMQASLQISYGLGFNIDTGL